MKIEFAKIGHTPMPFAVKYGNIGLDCMLKKIYGHQVELDGKIAGKLEEHCDRCGKVYKIDTTGDLKLLLSEEVVSDKADLDIIEFLNGVIDLDYILESEIDAIKSFYHYCDECAQSTEELELEL